MINKNKRLVLDTSGLLGGVLGQDYGPVSLDAIDPLTLSWNQVYGWGVQIGMFFFKSLKPEISSDLSDIKQDAVVNIVNHSELNLTHLNPDRYFEVIFKYFYFKIHWLVRDQIKEVEEIKQEHDEIYNQITGEISDIRS